MSQPVPKTSKEDKKVYFEQDPDRKIRLEKLKSQLRKDYPECIREYEAGWDAEAGRPVPESFAQLVLDDLEGIIRREVKPERVFSCLYCMRDF